MSEIRLSASGYEAGAAPALGGVLTFLRYRGRDLMRPAVSLAAVREEPRNAACFACVPYFGRLYGGLAFEGRRWEMSPTFPACDPKEALHGEGWISSWDVVEQADESMTLRLVHNGTAPGRFPFPYVAEQRIALSPRGALLTLSVMNCGLAPMPASPALHPFFVRGSQTRISFSADGFWTPPQNGQPGQAGAIPNALSFSGGAALPEMTLDHSYSGFKGDVLIEGSRGRIALSANAPNLHVYAPKGEDFFCLEPLTGLPGAPALPALAAGASIALEMMIAAA